MSFVIDRFGVRDEETEICNYIGASSMTLTLQLTFSLASVGADISVQRHMQTEGRQCSALSI